MPLKSHWEWTIDNMQQFESLENDAEWKKKSQKVTTAWFHLYNSLTHEFMEMEKSLMVARG